jgi:DNA-binding MarR family transcriptional regulator
LAPTRTPTEDELALADNLWGVIRLFKVVAQRATQSVEQSSPERARLLYSLKAGACRAGFLAHQARISPSSVTEVVEDLERDGLVRRESDPDDRRGVRVALTAEGRRHLQRFEHAMALALAESLQGLTPVQRQRVKSAFADLREVAASAEQKETANAR